MPRTRTFIGIDPGADIRAAAADLQPHLAATGAGVKWADPDGMHVTLAFLGEVDDRELFGVCRAVAKVAAGEPAFELRVGGVGAFPNLRRPKVLWAGLVGGADELVRLHDALEPLLEPLGYRREERAYTPHLTLGRVTAEADGHLLAPALTELADWDGGDHPITEVLVYSSHQERDGPVYTVVGRAPLAGRRPERASPVET